MNGRTVVETGSLNVTDVIGLAAFLSLFLALLGPWYPCYPWCLAASLARHSRLLRRSDCEGWIGKGGSASTLQRREAPFRVTSHWFRFCTSVNGQK
jgi:hypothetical protein